MACDHGKNMGWGAYLTVVYGLINGEVTAPPPPKLAPPPYMPPPTTRCSCSSSGQERRQAGTRPEQASIHPETATADGRPDFQASGSEWRTPPLWGLGLRPVVNERVGLLHDGRARTVLEAILWHGGQGQGSADAVRRLAPQDRTALLRFLDSL